MSEEHLYYERDGIVVRRSTKEDVEYLKDKLRDSDREEMWKAFHMTAEEGLELSYEKSLIALTVQNGSPLAMFGINPYSILGYKAAIWLLGTEDLNGISIRFLKNCKKYVDKLLEFYPVLENYVDAENVETIEWLRFIGAKVDRPRPYGIEGKMFCRFEFRKCQKKHMKPLKGKRTKKA